jgi:hypothetical protein
MIQRQGVALTFYAHFVDTTGVSVTGLTVTVDVYEGVSGTPVVAAASATEQANGLYYYVLSGGSVDADGAYIAIFETASGSVAQKHLPALQSVGNIVNSAVQSVAANAITAAAIATDAIDNDAIAANAVTEIQSGLATAAALPTVGAIADAVLGRGVSNVEDTADTTSLAALILMALESSISGTTLTIRKTTGSNFVVKTVTIDAAAEPITGVD